MATKGKFTETTAPIKIVHSNLEQVLIRVTEDKIRLVLNEHLKNVERKNEWVTPLSLAIAIVTTFVTAEFKDAYLSADTWRAIFIIVGIGSLLWLIRAIWLASRAPTVNDIVAQIKNQLD